METTLIIIALIFLVLVCATVRIVALLVTRDLKKPLPSKRPTNEELMQQLRESEIF